MLKEEYLEVGSSFLGGWLYHDYDALYPYL